MIFLVLDIFYLYFIWLCFIVLLIFNLLLNLRLVLCVIIITHSCQLIFLFLFSSIFVDITCNLKFICLKSISKSFVYFNFCYCCFRCNKFRIICSWFKTFIFIVTYFIFSLFWLFLDLLCFKIFLFVSWLFVHFFYYYFDCWIYLFIIIL